MISLALWIVVGLNAGVTLWHLWSIRRLRQREREVMATLDFWMGLQRVEIAEMPAYRVGGSWVIAGDGAAEAEGACRQYVERGRN